MFHLAYLIFTSTLAFAVNPPWQNVDSLLKGTFGADPCVSVSDFQEATGTITIQACQADVAAGLALVIKPQFNFARTVTVRVLGPDGQVVTPASDPGDSALDLVQMSLENAFLGNPFYVSLVKGNGYLSVFVELKRRIVQYWGDDIGDAYGNLNYTAEEAFLRVINTSYFGRILVGVTMAPISKPL